MDQRAGRAGDGEMSWDAVVKRLLGCGSGSGCGSGRGEESFLGRGRASWAGRQSQAWGSSLIKFFLPVSSALPRYHVRVRDKTASPK